MSDETYEEIHPIIAKIADGVWWKYRTFSFIEYDDIYQEIWVYYLEHSNVLAEMLTSSGGTYIVKSRLYSAGSAFCRKEMAYHLGSDWADRLGYSKAEIRGYVRMILSGGPDGYGAGEHAFVGCADVRTAMNALSGKDRRALDLAYGPAERDPLRETDRTNAARAVGRVQKALNGGLWEERQQL